MTDRASPPSVEAWALRLPRRFAGALASLRLAAGVEVAEDGDTLWLRGRGADEELRGALRGLPADDRFAWLEGGRLRREGSWLIAASLPPVRWLSLREWWRVSLPASHVPGDAPPPLMLTLRAGGGVQAPGALLVELETWLAWMEHAPLVRLARLRFVVQRAERRALVIGTPLPPLPGRAGVVFDGIIVPAGQTWRPGVSARTLRRVLGVPDEEIVWWDEAGARRLGGELWVPASRAAARATRAALTAPGEGAES